MSNAKSSFSIPQSQEVLSFGSLDSLYDGLMGINIAKWIKDARKHKGLSQEALGEALGRTKGNVSGWENERHEPSLEQLMQISQITSYPLPTELGGTSRFGVEEEQAQYLTQRLPGKHIQAIEDHTDLPDAVLIRKVKLKLSAGIMGFSVERELEDGTPIFFRKSWLEQRGYRPDALIALRVRGDSMEPGLYDGDTVVINTDDRKPRDGEVYAVNYEGEDVIKRLVRDYGNWWLVSDNPDQRRFSRKRCEGDACIIIGKVVHKQSERI